MAGNGDTAGIISAICKMHITATAMFVDIAEMAQILAVSPYDQLRQGFENLIMKRSIAAMKNDMTKPIHLP
ncbi:MAG: hypothetical protein MJY66_03385 [Bacteroidaceae bacterium]|nr:hypothetical protein [Bacteroidaceae bacterium]